MTVDGRAIQDHAVVVAHPAVREILATFGRAEAAIQKQDLGPLLQFYAKGYNYHGLKPADVRRIWGEVFAHYRNLSSTHLFSEVKLVKSGAQWRAEITCTGGLYGTEAQGGTRVTLDSWFREVHYLAYEEGAGVFSAMRAQRRARLHLHPAPTIRFSSREGLGGVPSNLCRSRIGPIRSIRLEPVRQ